MFYIKMLIKEEKRRRSERGAVDFSEAVRYYKTSPPCRTAAENEEG